MQISIIQLLNLIFILGALFFVGRYVWGMLYDKNYQPPTWQQAVKTGKISKELIRYEKNYPDKVRFFNWWFQLERIKKDNIQGAIAELGVYKGESAKAMHLMAPEKKLYLLDTFEGFVKDELDNESGEAATYTPQHFGDTSEEKVRHFLGNSSNIIFLKGSFPESATPIADELFSLVNIDVDLHKPTLAGLEFFYQKLAPGGVILIHDYTHKWEGLQNAVDQFVTKIPESLVPVPDMDGTVMIVKNRLHS